MERRAGVYAWVLRELLEADTRTRRQSLRSGVLASGLEHPLLRKRIHGDRTAGCKNRRQRIEKQMPFSRNGQRKERRRMKGMQCPRKVALEACLDRCMARKWTHHAALGKGLDRQSLQRDSRWHSCPTPPWWPRGATFARRARVLRQRKVARDYECGLSR
jgi:hypothetical protein